MCVVADPKDPSPPSDPVAMDGRPEAILLLEHAASDDLPSLTSAAAGADLPHDAPSRWYGRWWAHGGLRPVRYERRTTLMVAALYGSASVVEHLLSSDPSSANRRCGSDSATPLHCAAAGGAPSAPRVVRLLLSAGADPSLPDASGRTPADLLPRHSRSRPALEALLRGGDPEEEEEEWEEETKPVSVAAAVEKKKEYPVDATLPDIKSGIYGTDEFRMYTFKVKPCSRAYSHDWTECPFVHPGENARRRDPRKYHYSCVPCPDFRKGSCRNGDACEYAHGVFESWLHPAQYRTRLCKDETGCTRRVCFFAHKPEELRPLYPSSSPSPRGGSSAAAANLLPPLDLGAAAAMLLNQQQQQPTSTALAAWLNGAPTTPLPSSSRLKVGVTARDIDVDLDLMGFDAYASQQHLQQKKQQQNLMDEIGSISPPSSWSNPLQLPMGSPIARGAGVGGDYGDIFGSVDSSSPCPPSPSLLSPMKGLSLKPSGSSFQSPTQLQKHQQQLLYGVGGNLPSSPSARSSSPSLATTLMSSRASAFAKQRSQSFVDRGATRLSSLPVTTTTPVVAPVISDWGSPDGKVDWAIQGDELSKLRKSASFAFRGGGVANGPAFAAEEPDVSWVHSLVKDGPPMTTTAAGAAEPRRQQYPTLNGGAAAGGGGGGGERFSSGWGDQLYLEQEQMVA